MGGLGSGSMWGFGALGFITMLLFWVGAVGVTALLWRAFFPGERSPREMSAREILDARYARGELTEEQHRQMRREIQQGWRDGAAR